MIKDIVNTNLKEYKEKIKLETKWGVENFINMIFEEIHSTAKYLTKYPEGTEGAVFDAYREADADEEATKSIIKDMVKNLISEALMEV